MILATAIRLISAIFHFACTFIKKAGTYSFQQLISMVKTGNL